MLVTKQVASSSPSILSDIYRTCDSIYSCFNMFSLTYGASPAVYNYYYMISHVHRAYDYSGPFGVLWVHMTGNKNGANKFELLY